MNKLIAKMPTRPNLEDSRQGKLELLVDRQVESDGIGMGVLRDGTPFLNQRGLARLCGVENRYIGLISTEWNSPDPSERTKSVRGFLIERGEDSEFGAYETFFGKRRVVAYPDVVCMAVLEYYAFEAKLVGEPVARDNYRKLARHGLRQFIYTQVGYSSREQSDPWRIFHDRVSLTYDAVPSGYFGVFSELASLIVTLGERGLHIDESFVPDISVGQAWARHWAELSLAGKYSERTTYEHNYPPYFPQAASNPQIASCYPEIALGEFRRWFREDYIGEGRFKKYLIKKVKDRILPEGYVERALIALAKE